MKRKLLASMLTVTLAACGALPTDTAGLSASGATRTTNARVSVTVAAPPGVTADVRVRGPGSATWPVTGGMLDLRDAPPGEYHVEGRDVLAHGFRYRPLASSGVLVLGPGTHGTSRVTYDAASGAATVTVSEVNGESPTVTIAGYGYHRTLSSAGTYALDDLVPGPYRVTADTLASDGQTFVPVVVSEEITVRVGVRSGVTIDSLIQEATQP